MSSVERAQQILAGLKEAEVNLVASVPDINLLQLINLLAADTEIAHIPVGREEEGIGVCAGAYLVRRRANGLQSGKNQFWRAGSSGGNSKLALGRNRGRSHRGWAAWIGSRRPALYLGAYRAGEE